ncbi:MAG TPA: glycosidase, partial [Candidatus Brachybacterium intestinipullorum]|nr:glycosidase [Candidatus Brachybacterium intestinipullorum]
VAAHEAADAGDESPRSLQLLAPAAAGRILEAHQRLLSLRRRERWLVTASVAVDEATLTNTWAQIVLTPTAGGHDAGANELDTTADGEPAAADRAADATDPSGERPAPLTLVLNLGDEALPAPGAVLEAVSGADMLDAVGPAPDGTVPAHGIAVVR